MKIIEAEFSDYKNLKDCSMMLDKHPTLLIGSNNSGKTTVLEALYYTFNHRRLVRHPKHLLNFRKILNKGNNVTDGKVKIRFIIDSTDLDMVLNVCGIPYSNECKALLDSIFLATWTFSNIKNSVQITLEKSKNLSLDTKISDKICDNLPIILGNTVLFISNDRNIPASERLKALEKLLHYTSKNEVRNYVYYLLKEDSKFLNKLQILLPKNSVETFLNSEKNIVELKVKFNVSETKFDINEMGSGFKNTLLLLSKMELTRAKIILIDEPDLGMHASLINNFIKFVENSMNVQVIITSHNENLINTSEEENIKHVFSQNPISSYINPLSSRFKKELLTQLGVNHSNFDRLRLKDSELVIFIEDKLEEEEKIKKLIRKTNFEIDDLKIAYATTRGAGLKGLDVLDTLTGEKFPFIILRDRDEIGKDYIEKSEQQLGEQSTFLEQKRNGKLLVRL